MKRYQPTTEEIDALFIVAPFLNDAIEINNDYFYDEETTDYQRKVIFESSKAMFKACLKIIQSNKLLPFG